MVVKSIIVNSSQPTRLCSGYPPVYVPKFIENNPNLEINFFVPYNGVKIGKLACSLIKSRASGSNTMGNHYPTETKNETNDLLSFDLDPSKPVVIFCHGIRSWRNQLLLYHVASGLTESLGYHTLRFDFEGNGHSNTPGVCVDFCDQFVTHALEAIVNFVHNELHCRVSCIVGHSLGAVVTMKFAVEHEIRIERNDIETEYLIPYFINVCGGYSFSRIDFAKIKKSSLMTIHGGQDRVVPVTDAHKINAAVSNHKLILFEDADHNFNGLKYIKEIVSSISSFISG